MIRIRAAIPTGGGALLRRRQAQDRGFVLSDHVDWLGLLEAIRLTGAEHVLVTHGYTKPLVRWLNEQGLKAEVLAKRFVGEAGDSETVGVPDPRPPQTKDEDEEEEKDEEASP